MKNHLKTFLEEGNKFNGTNIWLSNLTATEDVFFAHNQTEKNRFQVLDKEHIYTFGNGDLDDEWEKQKLMRNLLD